LGYGLGVIGTAKKVQQGEFRRGFAGVAAAAIPSKLRRKQQEPTMQALDLETLIDRRFSSGEDADAEDVLRRTREAPRTRRKFDG
jgi:hypothetical protein